MSTVILLKYCISPSPNLQKHPWIMLFCLSKVPELVDTLFLILRKKPVIFLHWYHHFITLLYCWWGWASQTPTGRTFAGMNLFVHSIMYSYYAIMAAHIRFVFVWFVRVLVCV